MHFHKFQFRICYFSPKTLFVLLTLQKKKNLDENTLAIEELNSRSNWRETQSLQRTVICRTKAGARMKNTKHVRQTVATVLPLTMALTMTRVLAKKINKTRSRHSSRMLEHVMHFILIFVWCCSVRQVQLCVREREREKGRARLMLELLAFGRWK